MACAQPNHRKDIYDYMKGAYIDRGAFRSIDDLLEATAKDLGRSPDDIAKILAEPKSVRKVSNDAYLAAARRRRAISGAKAWIKAKDDPALVKAFNLMTELPFAVRVLGHGPVSFGVHGAPYLYMPTRYKIFFDSYLKSWKNFTDVGYEKMAQAIEKDPEFAQWNKALKGTIDPARNLDDFQMYADFAAKKLGKSAAPLKAFSELSRRGSQQFQGIKLLRLNLAKDYWNKLSPHLRTDAARDSIGDYVNHMTGVSPTISVLRSTKGGSIGSTVMFAPSLEAARWLRITDVAKTFKDIFHSDPGVRRFALSRLRDYVEMGTTYMSALAANQAFLAGTGIKVNMTDKNKPDYLSFKLPNGDSINVTGGQTNTMRFLMRMLTPQRDKEGKKLGASAAYYQMSATAGKYALGKQSPLISTILEPLHGYAFGEGGKQKAISGLPWGPSVQPGEKTFGLGSYLAERQSPIPVSGAAQNIISSGKAEEGIVPFLAEGLLGGRYMKAEGGLKKDAL